MNTLERLRQYWQWIITLICGLAMWTALPSLTATYFVVADARYQSDEAVRLPQGFVLETLTTGLITPIDMAILPSGDLLIAQKGQGEYENSTATIYLLHEPDGIASLETLMTLDLNAQGDSGILSVVLDPAFDQNHTFYVWHSTPGTAEPFGIGGTSKNRLSRFTLDIVTREVDRAADTILLDNIPRGFYHGGGGLVFDSQGYLYLTVGDAWDYRWGGHVSQNLSSPLGKLLRIRPTNTGYQVPDGNPFVDITGAIPEIYALGLRNPFRMTHRSTDDAIFIGDVGGDVWEELNVLRQGANYGWPLREGPCLRSQRYPCTNNSEGFDEPIFYYEHPVGVGCCQGGAIAGMAFYEGTRFPTEYHNRLFIADYNHQFIASIDPGESSEYQGPHFAENIGALTDLEYFDESLYLLDIIQGSVSRLSYLGEESPPVAHLRIDTELGAAPLTIQLDGSASYSPQELPLFYEWTLGDGASIATTSPLLTHTFEADNTYQVKLTAVDSMMRRSPASTVPVSVYSREIPTISVAHQNELGRIQFRGGDRFTFFPVRTIGQTDLNPERPFTWDLALHHNQHVHPLLVRQNSISHTLTIPQVNHGGLNIWYEIGLTMHTVDGQSISTKAELPPQLTEVWIETEPPLSGTLKIDGHPYTFPSAFDAIVNITYTVEMPYTIHDGTTTYRFVEWATVENPTLVETIGTRKIIPTSQEERFVAIYVNRQKATYLPMFR
ncbi:MAG: PQQ-dependent sugar dehydrogenase [Chloroflexota bacterium]